MTGQRFGDPERPVIVLGYSPNTTEPRANGTIKRLWRCQCPCGKEFDALASALKKGQVTSCGCGIVHLDRTRAAASARAMRFDVEGKQLTVAEIAERAGITTAAVYERLYRQRLSPADAASPVRPPKIAGPRRTHRESTTMGVRNNESRALALRALERASRTHPTPWTSSEALEVLTGGLGSNQLRHSLYRLRKEGLAVHNGLKAKHSRWALASAVAPEAPRAEPPRDRVVTALRALAAERGEEAWLRPTEITAKVHGVTYGAIKQHLYGLRREGILEDNGQRTRKIAWRLSAVTSDDFEAVLRYLRQPEASAPACPVEPIEPVDPVPQPVAAAPVIAPTIALPAAPTVEPAIALPPAAVLLARNTKPRPPPVREQGKEEPAKHTTEGRAAARRSSATRATDAKAGDPMIALYFQDMARERLLTVEEESAAAARIEEAEIEHWAALLSYPPACSSILVALQQQLRDKDVESPASLPELLDLVSLATLTDEQTERLQALARDLGRAVRLPDADRTWVAEARTIAKDVAKASGASSEVASAYIQRIETTFRAQSDAKNILAKANLRFAVSVARRYNRGHLPFADLIQEANVGLLMAVDRFNPHRGFRFTTYSQWWIRHAMMRAIQDKVRLVRVPVHVLEVNRNVHRIAGNFVTKNGRGPTVEELHQETGLPVEKIQRALDIGSGVSLSMDRPIGDEEDGHTFLDMAVDPEAISPLDRLASARTEDRVTKLLDKLPAFEATILRARFGLGDDHDKTLKEIGDAHNLSRERIRQLQEQGLARLRRLLDEANADSTSHPSVTPRPERAPSQRVANQAPLQSVPECAGSTPERAGVATAPTARSVGSDSDDEFRRWREQLNERRQLAKLPPAAQPLPPNVPATIPRRETPLVRPRDQSSFVVYRGPSAFDGSTIVAIVTNVSRSLTNGATTNDKLGQMAQLHILVADAAPNVAKKHGWDAAVCGDCDLRNGRGGIRCYVNVAFSTTTLWKAHAWRPVEVNACVNALGRTGLHLRLGAYGDPAALPEHVVRDLVAASAGATGYTHDWRKPQSQWLKAYAMASVENGADAHTARDLGWRTFRIVASEAAPLGPEEMLCPSVTHGRHCEECRLCDGAHGARGDDDARRVIAIPVHGRQTTGVTRGRLTGASELPGGIRRLAIVPVAPRNDLRRSVSARRVPYELAPLTFLRREAAPRSASMTLEPPCRADMPTAMANACETDVRGFYDDVIDRLRAAVAAVPAGSATAGLLLAALRCFSVDSTHPLASALAVLDRGARVGPSEAACSFVRAVLGAIERDLDPEPQDDREEPAPPRVTAGIRRSA